MIGALLQKTPEDPDVCYSQTKMQTKEDIKLQGVNMARYCRYKYYPTSDTIKAIPRGTIFWVLQDSNPELLRPA